MRQPSFLLFFFSSALEWMPYHRTTTVVNCNSFLTMADDIRNNLSNHENHAVPNGDQLLRSKLLQESQEITHYSNCFHICSLL